MVTPFEQALAKRFWIFSNSFAVRLSGGVLNYLFKPSRYEGTNQTEIVLANLDAELFLQAAKKMVLNPVRSVEVYSLTSQYGAQEAPKNSKYIGWICIVVIVTAMTIILIALAAWNPFSTSRRRSSKRTSKELTDGTLKKAERITETMKIYYRFLVVTCPILLICAFTCFVITCYALSSVTSSLNTDNSSDTYRSKPLLKTHFATVSDAYTSVVRQFCQFLNNIVKIGLELTSVVYAETLAGLETQEAPTRRAVEDDGQAYARRDQATSAGIVKSVQTMNGCLFLKHDFVPRHYSPCVATRTYRSYVSKHIKIKSKKVAGDFYGNSPEIPDASSLQFEGGTEYTFYYEINGTQPVLEVTEATDDCGAQLGPLPVAAFEQTAPMARRSPKDVLELSDTSAQGLVYNDPIKRLNEGRMREPFIVSRSGYQIIVDFGLTLMMNALDRFGAFNIFQEIFDLEKAINDLQSSTMYIADTSTETINKVNDLKGRLSEYKRNLTSSFGTLCHKIITPSERNECRKIYDQLDVFELEFDSSLVVTEPIKEISDSGILDSITNSPMSEFEDVLQKLENILNETIMRVTEQADVSPIFREVEKFWTELEPLFIQNVEGEMTRSLPKVDKIIRLLSTSLQSVCYTLLALEMIVLMLLTIYYLLNTTEASERQILFVSNFNGVKRIESTQHRGNLEPDAAFPGPRHVTNKASKAILVFSSLCIVLVFLCGALILAVILVNNECCRYIYTDKGINVTDSIINLFVKDHWSGVIHYIGKYDYLLNDRTPRNLARAVIRECGLVEKDANFSTGLLPKVGIDNLVNISALISMFGLKEGLDKNWEGVRNYLRTENLTQYVPGDIQNYISELAAEIEGLLTADYSVSIRELRNVRKNHTARQDQARRMLSYVASYASVFPDAKAAQNTLHTYLVTSPAYNSTYDAADELADQYAILQSLKNLTQAINQLNNSLTNLTLILSNNSLTIALLDALYEPQSERFIENITKLVQRETMYYTEHIIPCHYLYAATNSAINMVCDSGAILNRFGAFFGAWSSFMLVMLMTVMFFQHCFYLHEKMCMYSQNQAVPLSMLLQNMYSSLWTPKPQ
ncbi:unnamed protein product [Calicophoron daubneyi]|uniref:Uncharacterized protein n=1 Tax=Calicophoron daubneyi TaxID=300641 RepID=A0AAV2TEW1_CALDB